MKNTIIILVLIFGVYFLVNIYKSIESDPCDVKCDNCVSPIQCEECYNECYSTIK